jgi:tetratricopeptide (TPR) repeat protein
MAKVSLRAYNREIEAMIDRGHLDEAVAHCQFILKTFPKHVETYRLLGKAYLEAKRHNEAVDIFSRVLVAEPNDFVSQVGMSIIRDEQNKLDDAIWHMERAYESQSANPAIKGELQRLYGRRDGVQPPHVRMTRGALVHMYMRGELYPPAIAEAKSILQEDQGRSDVQVLLAKAYYKSGQKNDAADAASSVLKRYPYCLDANRVLTEVLGSDRPESAQVYRQRVIELDPYAAQVSGTVFQAGEVSDVAVTLDHLEWNGQSVGVPSDWGTTGAISLESGSSDRNVQPDWLKNAYTETKATPPPAPALGSGQEAFASAPAPAPAQPADDIPDFLRQAGWGESTGAFDESKASAMFDDAPAPATSAAEPIAQGDIPDWVKALAPSQAAQPAEEEEMPDWINKIGTGALAVPSTAASSDGDDWMSQLGEPAASKPQASSGDLDWMKDFGQEEQPVPASNDQPDWLRGLGSESESTPSSEGVSDFDFFKDITSEPEQPAPSQPSAVTMDTGSLGKSEEERDDSFAWLENLAAKQGATEGLLTKPEERLEDEPDWIKQAKGLNEPAKPVAQQPVETPKPAPVQQPAANMEDLGKSGQEIDDALAWFEGLAAKQGATEGLLTKPEERLDKEPDWVQKVKSSGNVQQQQTPAQQPAVQQPPVAETPKPAPAPQQAANVEDLGKSGQEIDDALAWFEGLAAKQGATEGLLTKPEERLDKEPDWVQKVKSSGGTQQPAAQQPPVAETPKPAPAPQPAANVEDLGKSGQEIDDALAWFEGLAAKQGATEGLLTKPEERMEQEPDWVKQVKSAPAPQPVVPQEPEEITPVDDVASWLKGLDKEEETQAPAPVAEDDTASWLKSLDEPEELPIASQTVSDDMPAWMRGISGEEAPVAESVVPMNEAEPVQKSEDVPSWLSGLEEDEKQTSASGDLPAWMRDETGEVVAEPTKIEPTRAADWKPVDEKKVEAVQPPPPAPKPVSVPKPEPTPKKPAASRKTEIKPATPPEPYKEPVTRRMTGMLVMPVDPILGSARNELSRSNIPGALETYEKLIKKGRFLEEVIYDLREALYRYPVEVSIWQTLGDAYMRANQLQDALDAYTKAEELLR